MSRMREAEERSQRYRVAYGESRRRYAEAKADLDWAVTEYGEMAAKLALGEAEEAEVAALEAEMDRLRAVVRREEAAVRWLWNEVGPVGVGATAPVPASG